MTACWRDRHSKHAKSGALGICGMGIAAGAGLAQERMIVDSWREKNSLIGWVPWTVRVEEARERALR